MRIRGASRVGILVAVVLGLIGAAALMGWLGDRSASGSLSDRGDAAFAFFRDFKDTGYRKPEYYSDMTEGEAWDSYSQVMAFIDSMPQEDRGFLSREYRQHLDSDLTQSARVVAEYGYVIERIKRGVRNARCTAPLEYDRGIMVRYPNYINLKVAGQLLACRARMKSVSDPTAALDDMLDLAVFAQDIAGGDLTLISHMIGTVSLRMANLEMEESIKRFHLGQAELLRLAEAMDMLAQTWPPLSRDIQGEWSMQAVSLRSFPELYDEMAGAGFFGWWANHVLSWRHLFSYGRVQNDALSFYEGFLSDLKEQESRGLSNLRTTIETWSNSMPGRRNWILILSMPNLEPMYRRRFEAVSYARVVGTSALLARHLLANEDWPESLRALDTAGTDNILIDPMSMEPLKYLVYEGGDSVSVYSIGGNLEDDGGLADRENGDLVVTLHKASQ